MMQANVFFRKEKKSRGLGFLLVLLGTLLLTSNLAAASALTITTTSPLPNGTVDTLYSTTFAATGGTAPYAWTVTSGSVPGHNLDGSVAGSTERGERLFHHRAGNGFDHANSSDGNRDL